ncbi:MAG: hypothetical protein KF868_00490 [Acidobacteria bacterium]|nr:hypothetical protein [Acidobacteriota bacterium]
MAITRHLMVEHREAIRDAFKRAVQQALLQHKRAGNPVAASENGRIIWIAPEQIQIDRSA